MRDSSQSANTVPPQSNGSGHDGQQQQVTNPLTRLPWTAAGETQAAPAWQNQYAHQSGDEDGGFAMPPSSEEIPGFPFPTAGSSTQQANSIKPLPRAAGAPIATQMPAQAPQYQHQQRQMQTQPQMPALGANTTGRLGPGVLPGSSGVSTDQLATGYLDQLEVMFTEPRTLQETGINQGLISDLVLKTMYYTSYMSGQEISTTLRLPFYGILDQIIGLLKKEQLCEVSGTSGLGEAGYQYILTIKGMERAHQVLARSKYVGPVPVPLSKYIEVIRMQSARRPTVNRELVEQALRGMVMSDDLIDQVGSAVNAGKSLFLFGAPGNGKTLLAERIATMLGGNIAIPYALESDGQVIQLFDLNSHRPAVPQGASEMDPTKAELGDRRWLRIHRPVVVVGGELTMASLDLIFNENIGFYEAPFQLKANGGLFLIDDFGRQQVSPQALLNRWIVPLEKGIDFLTLKTGKKLQVPFELFLVLSTNLQPEDLIDDAFLRRIQNKLNVPDPTAQQFFEIFVAQCRLMNVPFNQQGFIHLVNHHYKEIKRPFRASQPRDLLRQLIGIARYRNVPPEMTQQLVDAACATYFVNAKK